MSKSINNPIFKRNFTLIIIPIFVLLILAFFNFFNGFNLNNLTGKVIQEICTQQNITLTDILVDNNDAGLELGGYWRVSNATIGYYGKDYLHDNSSLADPAKYAKFNFNIEYSGEYKVFVFSTAYSNRPDAVPVSVSTLNGIITKNINQQKNSSWYLLGIFNLTIGNNYVLINASDAGYTIADAVKIEAVNKSFVLRTCELIIINETNHTQTNNTIPNTNQTTNQTNVTINNSACVDLDRDGFGVNCASGLDCNDNNYNINPSVIEICSDNLDNNCNSQIDEGCFVNGNITNVTNQTSGDKTNQIGKNLFVRSYNAVAGFFMGLFGLNGQSDVGVESLSCGNGIVELGEECEDFNTKNGDGCSSTCTLEGKSDCAFGYAKNITQYKMTWVFDKCYRVGQFANGDYWVYGPVTITRITPDFYNGTLDTQESCTTNTQCNNKYYYTDESGTFLRGDECGSDNECKVRYGTCMAGKCSYALGIHGYQIDPVKGGNGFDSRINGFSTSFIPTLPTTITGNKSLIKIISQDDSRPAVKTAAVLTILDQVPLNNGISLFRPNYYGPNKYFYSIDDLRLELLSNFKPVEYTYSISRLYDQFRKVHMDHNWEQQRPLDNIKQYYPDQSAWNSNAVLRLMLNDSIEKKLPLLYVVVQAGIDNYYIYLGGQDWSDGRGVEPGHELLPAFAATMLNNSEMKSVVRRMNIAAGVNSYIKYSKNTNPLFNVSIYGVNDTDLENRYWSSIGISMDQFGKEVMDPYGFIDGGGNGGGGPYQTCCNSQPFRETAFSFYLMPELQIAYNFSDKIFNYMDRWTNIGIWTQPDPCAPPVGICGPGDNQGTPCTLANEIEVCKNGKIYSESYCWVGVCKLTKQPCGLRSDISYYNSQISNCGASNLDPNQCILNPVYYKNSSSSLGYGPDPFNPSMCILDNNKSDGIGRTPLRQGYNKNSGIGLKDTTNPRSFIDAMWNAYRGPSCYNSICEEGENSLNCPFDCDPNIVFNLNFEDYNPSLGIVEDKSGMNNNGDCDLRKDQCPKSISLSDGTKAVEFKGNLCSNSSDYFHVEDSSSMDNLSKGTISVWAKFKNDTSGTTILLETYQYVPPRTGTWELGKPSGGWGGTTSFTLFNGTASVEAFSFPDSNNYNWNNYIVSWDGDLIKGYFNGVEIGSYSQNETPQLKLGQYIAIGASSHSEPRNKHDNNCITMYYCNDLCSANCSLSNYYCPVDLPVPPTYIYNGPVNQTVYRELFRTSLDYKAIFMAELQKPDYFNQFPNYYVYPNHGFMNGFMDEINIYNQSLSSNQIKLKYDAYFPKYADPICNNNLLQTDEVCDGIDLNGKDCSSFGYNFGTLKCNNNCSGYDLTFCSNTPQTCTNCNSIFEGEHNLKCDLEKCHYLGDYSGEACYFDSSKTDNCINQTIACSQIENNCSKVSKDECSLGICGLDCSSWGTKCTDFDSSLLVHFDFDKGILKGRVKDSSGYGHDGTCNYSANKCPTEAISYDQSKAANFDRYNYLILSNYSKLKNLTSGTISMQIYENSISSNEGLIGGIDTTAVGSFGLTRSASSVYKLSIINSSKQEKVLLSYPDAVGKWIQYAFTWDGTTINKYINGVLNLSISQSGINYLSVKPYGLRIGADISTGFPTSSDLFSGKMDDFMIFNRSLNQAEILALYNHYDYCVADTDCPSLDCKSVVCNSGTHTCVYSSDSSKENLACSDDRNSCTSDICRSGSCVHENKLTGAVCDDDGNDCTSDTCSAGLCQHNNVADETPCSDEGILCTQNEKCFAGKCKPTFLDNSSCSDRSSCAQKQCTLTGCVYSQCSNGYVAYYNFEDSLLDNVSNDVSIYGSDSGHSAYCTDGRCPILVEGYNARGALFNDNRAYLKFDLRRNIDNAGQLTVCAWVNLSTLGTTNDADDGAIFSHAGEGGNVLLWYDVNKNSTSLGTHSYSFLVGLSGTAGDSASSQVNSAIAGQWQHVCGVLDGNLREVYINGRLNGTFTPKSVSTWKVPPMEFENRIGSLWNSPNYYFNGTIDDVKIYKVALSDEDIWQIYSEPRADSVFFNSPEPKMYNTNNVLVDIESSSDIASVWWNNGTRNFIYSTPTNYYFSEGKQNIFAYGKKLSGEIVSDNVTFYIKTKLHFCGDGIVDIALAPQFIDNINSSCIFTGAWTSTTGAPGYYGNNYTHDGNNSKGTKAARFIPTISEAGTHNVYVWWTAGINRASNVPVDIMHNNIKTTIFVDQRVNGSKWVLIGSYYFSGLGNEYVEIRTNNTDGYVIADAVKIEGNFTEDCDDGNLINGDGCSSECKFSNGPDTTPPTFTNLVNQQLTFGESLNYDINAIDASDISCFNVNDTTRFNINCAGLLTNKTALALGMHYLGIKVNDTFNNVNSAIIFLNVSDNVIPSVPTCTLTSASWDRINASNGTSVGLNVVGSDCEGNFVNYTIYKSIWWWFDRKVMTNSTSGSTSWTANEVGDYYFYATNALNASNIVQSGNLKVYIENNPPVIVCGNGVIESGEVCDSVNLNNKNCSEFGFNAGTLSCNSSCTGFNTSLCLNIQRTCEDLDRDGMLDFNSENCTAGRDRCIQVNFDFTQFKPDFGGLNSSFDFVSANDYRNVTNLLMENKNITKLKFFKPLKLIRLNETGCFVKPNMSLFVKLERNKVEIDSLNFSELNKNAEIIFYNVSLIRPVVLKDRASCSDCVSVFNVSSKEFILNVSGFSVYEIVEQCLSVIKDGDETGVDCGGSCSACSSGGDGGSGGGGGGGGGSGGNNGNNNTNYTNIIRNDTNYNQTVYRNDTDNKKNGTSIFGDITLSNNAGIGLIIGILIVSIIIISLIIYLVIQRRRDEELRKFSS
jgi:cysteine-rich repeat protein